MGRQFPNARLLSPEMTAEEMARVAVVQIEAPGVVGTVRGAAAGGRKTVAIHLVNRNLDEFGRAAPVGPFGVRLMQPDFWGEIRSVEAIGPGVAAERAVIEKFGRGLRVMVRPVSTWTVLRIEGAPERV